MKRSSFFNEIFYVLLNKSNVTRSRLVIIAKKDVKTLGMRFIGRIRTHILSRAIVCIRMLDTRANALKAKFSLRQLEFPLFTRPIYKSFARNELDMFLTTHISAKNMIIFTTNVAT